MDPADQDVRHGAKKMMRERFAKQRASLPASAATRRSEAICERLLALDELAEASSVALFWPMLGRREVDLRPLDATLRERGVAVAYPAIDAERRMQFFFVDDPAEMSEAPMGYREPSLEKTCAEQLDVIVVPAIAYDARGYRIGYGGGFYDGALPRHCPPATAIGVAYDFQLAAEIPNTHGDVAIPRVVTDRRVLEIFQP